MLCMCLSLELADFALNNTLKLMIPYQLLIIGKELENLSHQLLTKQAKKL